jgi:hypothetical protein
MTGIDTAPALRVKLETIRTGDPGFSIVND